MMSVTSPLLRLDISFLLSEKVMLSKRMTRGTSTELDWYKSFNSAQASSIEILSSENKERKIENVTQVNLTLARSKLIFFLYLNFHVNAASVTVCQTDTSWQLRIANGEQYTHSINKINNKSTIKSTIPWIISFQTMFINLRGSSMQSNLVESMQIILVN